MNLRVLTKPLPTPPNILRQVPLRAGFFRSRLRSVALTARIGTLLGACLLARGQFAEAEKYDIIFQDAVYANPRIEITDKVIKTLEGKPPAR